MSDTQFTGICIFLFMIMAILEIGMISICDHLKAIKRSVQEIKSIGGGLTMTPTLKTANEIALEALDEQLDRHAASAPLGGRAEADDESDDSNK